MYYLSYHVHSVVGISTSSVDLLESVLPYKNIGTQVNIPVKDEKVKISKLTVQVEL